jgi:hypothetical protein
MKTLSAQGVTVPWHFHETEEVIVHSAFHNQADRYYDRLLRCRAAGWDRERGKSDAAKCPRYPLTDPCQFDIVPSPCASGS